MSTTELNDYLDWPGVQQVFRLTRERTVHGKTTTQVSFGITSLPRRCADAAKLLKLVREHWHIENREFHVRDVTLREDACRVRTGNAAPLLAELRSLVIMLIAAEHRTSIAAANRHFVAHVEEAIALIRAFP
jgi:hypothetical protein